MADPSGDRESLVDVVTSYHRGVADGLATLGERVRIDPTAEVGPTVERLVTEIVGVLVAEEQVLLPAARRAGVDEADTRAQFGLHREIEHALHRLEDLELTPDLLAPIVADVAERWDRLTGHLRAEVLPRLAATLSEAELARLGDDALGAIQVAPTHPRAVAPRSPELARFVGLAEGFVDRARDAWWHRGRGADDVTDPERDAP